MALVCASLFVLAGLPKETSLEVFKPFKLQDLLHTIGLLFGFLSSFIKYLKLKFSQLIELHNKGKNKAGETFISSSKLLCVTEICFPFLCSHMYEFSFFSFLILTQGYIFIDFRGRETSM